MSAKQMDFPRTPRLEAAAAARGAELAGARPLAGDGSDRRFYRLGGAPGVVLLYHPHPPGGGVTENDSYYLMGRHLQAAAVPVPEIYDYCREEGWMLLEDVGDLNLEAALQGPAREGAISSWYPRALEVLVHMQLAALDGFDPAWCFDTPAVDRPFLLERECAYFVQAFLQGYLGLKVTLADLAPDFDRLLALALPGGPRYFLHRDFQSRNLFIHQGSLRVLDFQGARLGPLGYDLAALLIDPYVDLDPARQEELLAAYLKLLKSRRPVDEGAFREQYPYLALCRNLQVLGAFGFLTRVKGKDYFARHIPAALAGLVRRLQARGGEFPLLAAVLTRVREGGAGAGLRNPG
jgi:aminoglycoside/choline kinase family phosphotransferase